MRIFLYKPDRPLALFQFVRYPSKMILVVLLALGVLLSLGECQRGHYIRPLEPRYTPAITYGLPVYEEVPVVPRLYPGLFQTHPPPQYRSRKTNRADDAAPKLTAPKLTAPVPSSVPAAPSSPSSAARSEEADQEPHAAASAYPILSYSNQMGNDGDYSYKYETADGMRKEETSVMTTSEDGKSARSVRGSYSYPTADGRTIRVDYVADEGGFRATTVSEGEAAAGVGTTFRRMGERGFIYTYRAPSVV